MASNSATMPCPNQPTCTLTRRLATSHVLHVFRAFHCENGGSRCERLRRLVGGEPVPADLLPDGRSLAAVPIGREAA